MKGTLCFLLTAVLLTPLATLLAADADNNVLPDGTVFRPWELSRRHARTFHVAQNDPLASDENPGTVERPWRTIGKAAVTLQPGERVIVHGGVYREWVRPDRGGTGPDEMIWYEAAPGEDVRLKGSEVWSPPCQATDSVWRAALDPKLFPGENPFALENFPVQPSPEWKRFPSMELRRGQLFLDGKPLTQVATRDELLQANDSFWVDPDGNALQVRLAGGASPEGRSFELTCREQVFAPDHRGLNKPFEIQGTGHSTRAEWGVSGNDVKSVELPLQVTFDPDRMEPRVTAPAGAKLPRYEPFALTPGLPPVKELLDQNFVQPVDYQLGSDYAPMERLLQADLLGRKRAPRQFDVGPLVDLPLDGSAITVDPRHLRE